eukprot:TRINITY_DN36068_c0_g1_i2.p1 TRINITY_DN36068_c0_g1~~TRINITY_DN36068_c0_g1_i2.p1  ORF type:complete len:169 (+),score=61.41 TRINITY_DN36068_c0_g1_i2:99-605(+)
MNELEQRVKHIDDSDETDEEEEERAEAKTMSSRISGWVWTFVWLAASAVTMQQSDFIGVLLHSNLVRRYALYVAVALLGLTICGGVHLTRTAHPDDYEHVVWESLPKQPHAVPTMVVLWLSGSTFLAIAIWPVYHMLTFPLMFMMFMGFVHLLHFIPGSSAPESAKKK